MDTPRSSHRAGDLEIDPATGEVSREDGAHLRLSPIHMAVLERLVDARGEVVRRADLFDQVWPNQDVSDDALTRAISDLRQQLKSAFGETAFIETLPKRGYRWTASAPSAGSYTAPEQESRPIEHAPFPAPQEPRPRALARRIAIYLLAAMALTSALVWTIDLLTAPAESRVAILPTDAAGPGNALAGELDELIAAELLGSDRLEFLSHSAIASRPSQAFPYLHAQLGADWVVESRLRPSETGRFLLTLSVADARTAIVSVSRSMEVDGDRASLAGAVRNLVGQVRPYLQSTTGP